jgi:hypothetical protein
MRRHIPGLHQAAATQEQEIPDGFFLVRVERATYRAYKVKPFLTLIFAVEEPRQFSACRFSACIYCTPKAVWKLSWFAPTSVQMSRRTSLRFAANATERFIFIFIFDPRFQRIALSRNGSPG